MWPGPAAESHPFRVPARRRGSCKWLYKLGTVTSAVPEKASPRGSITHFLLLYNNAFLTLQINSFPVEENHLLPLLLRLPSSVLGTRE